MKLVSLDDKKSEAKQMQETRSTEKNDNVDNNNNNATNENNLNICVYFRDISLNDASRVPVKTLE